MKKFIFLYMGFEEPTPEIFETWMAWFKKIGSQTVDMGNAFSAGREVTKDGEHTDLDHSGTPITGYTIVNAESMDAAQALLEGLPMTHSVRIYELGAM